MFVLFVRVRRMCASERCAVTPPRNYYPAAAYHMYAEYWRTIAHAHPARSVGDELLYYFICLFFTTSPARRFDVPKKHKKFTPVPARGSYAEFHAPARFPRPRIQCFEPDTFHLTYPVTDAIWNKSFYSENV